MENTINNMRFIKARQYHIRNSSRCVYEIPVCDSTFEMVSKWYRISDITETNAQFCEKCLKKFPNIKIVYDGNKRYLRERSHASH